MKETIFHLTVVFCLLLTTNGMSEEAPRKVVDLGNNELILYGRDPLIVAVVKGSNRHRVPLAEIKKKDAVWKETTGISKHMRSLLTSPAAEYLNGIQKSKPYFAEIFLMDNQGANVAMTHTTSDYWQGDEAKFQKSFNQGKGAVFIDEVKYDESTQASLVQISVPVMDQEKAIGAITFGINVAKVDDDSAKPSPVDIDVEEKKRIDRYIVELAENGMRPTEIAKQLNEGKIPPPGGYPYWHSVMVKRILRRLNKH